MANILRGDSVDKRNPFFDRMCDEFPKLFPTIIFALKQAHAETVNMITPARMKSKYWREVISQMLYASAQQHVAETLSELTESGLVVRCMPNARGNYSHVEVQLPWAVITVHALAEDEKTPRKCVYRQSLCTNGQTDFFNIIDGETEQQKLYFAITHKRNRETHLLEDVRIISMSPMGDVGTLNVSIMSEGQSRENIVEESSVAVKEEVIELINRPKLKKSK